MFNSEVLEPKKRWRPRMIGPQGRSIYSKQPYDLELKSGDKITIRPRTYDAVVVHEIFRKKTYQPSLEIDPPQTILDLGANIGLFTVWAALRYSPEEIIAVEPVTDNYDLFNKNVGRLAIANSVDLFACAVTKDGRPVKMQVPGVNISGAHIVEDAASGETVPSMTLDQIAATTLNRIDFLKIDIEGTEGELFNDQNKELFAYGVGYVAMEIDRRSMLSPEETIEYFTKLGFETNKTDQHALNARGYFEAVNIRN